MYKNIYIGARVPVFFCVICVCSVGQKKKKKWKKNACRILRGGGGGRVIAKRINFNAFVVE